MNRKADLLRLAESCAEKAVDRLGAYLDSGNRHDTYNGDDRIETAERLLNCSRELRALAENTPEGGEGA